MDHNDARPHGRHFRDRMAETGCSKHRPKVALKVIQAARDYDAALAAARDARCNLIATAVAKAPDRRAALAVLNHIADSFGFHAFSLKEVTAAEPPPA